MKATTTFVVATPQGIAAITQGDEVAPDHPAVRAAPQYFTKTTRRRTKDAEATAAAAETE